MAGAVGVTLAKIAAFSYGLFNWCLYNALFLRAGAFFKKVPEKRKLDLAIARDRYWNLSKPFDEGLTHHFLTLRNGFKFHYVSNESSLSASASKTKNLVILLHGFPDSYVIWRKLLVSQNLREKYTVVAVDLPGYGGSEGFDKYGPTEVMEAVVEFIIAAREKYLGDDKSKTVIAAHDWGAVVALRLAQDAPQLADRFIISNGPLVPLVISNITQILSSASATFKQFIHHPSKPLFSKAIATLRPVLRQMVLSGYIALFNLPPYFIRQISTAANMAWMRRCHGMANVTETSNHDLHAAAGMAGTIGPSIHETKTTTPNGQTYPDSISSSRAHTHTADWFLHQTAYYNSRVSTGKWIRSPETLAALTAIEDSHPSASYANYNRAEAPRGSVNAPITVLWGANDVALDARICLAGYEAYMAPNSQLVMLEGVGHWLPLDMRGVKGIEALVDWEVEGGKKLDNALVEAGVTAELTISK